MRCEATATKLALRLGASRPEFSIEFPPPRKPYTGPHETRRLGDNDRDSDRTWASHILPSGSSRGDLKRSFRMHSLP
jgi:hypothetical protein